jgi:MFS family permease
VATFSPAELRGSAFGLLATVQAIGNLAASAIAGLLYTLASPAVAFGYLAAWMLAAPLLLIAPVRAATNPARH